MSHKIVIKYDLLSNMNLITREISTNTYGLRLPHIFEITSISNGKPSISMKIPSISNQKF